MDPFIEGLIVGVVSYTAALFVCISLCAAAASADRAMELLQERRRGK